MKKSGYFIIARIPDVTQTYRNRYIQHYERFIVRHDDERHKHYRAKYRYSKRRIVYDKYGNEHCLWFILTADKTKDSMRVFLLDSRFELTDITERANRNFDNLSIYAEQTFKKIAQKSKHNFQHQRQIRRRLLKKD